MSRAASPLRDGPPRDSQPYRNSVGSSRCITGLSGRASCDSRYTTTVDSRDAQVPSRVATTAWVTQLSSSEHGGLTTTTSSPARRTPRTFSGASSPYASSVSSTSSQRPRAWAPISPLVPPPPPFMGIPLPPAKPAAKPGLAILPKPPPQDEVHFHAPGMADIIATISTPTCSRAARASRFKSGSEAVSPPSSVSSSACAPPSRAAHHSLNGSPPSPPQPAPSPLSSTAGSRVGPTFHRSCSMPPAQDTPDRKRQQHSHSAATSASTSASPQPLSPVSSVSRPRAWTMAAERELLSSSLSSPPPCARRRHHSPSRSARISSSSSCSSSFPPCAPNRAARQRPPDRAPAQHRGSPAIRLARFTGRLLIVAYYAAVLYADVDAWHEREVRHHSALAQRLLLQSSYDAYGGGNVYGDLYGDAESRHAAAAAFWPPSLRSVRFLLATALPGGAGGGGGGAGGAHLFPWLHAALALPCLAALLLGVACEAAALALAARLLADLACHHSRGLFLFWRGERVQLLRLKELAVVGATLLAASRAGPGAASAVAAASAAGAAEAEAVAAEAAGLDDVLASQHVWPSHTPTSRLRGPQQHASGQESRAGTPGRASGTNVAVTERSPPPSPVMQQLQAQLLQVQRQQQAERRRRWGARAFWAGQRLLRRLGVALMLPLFAYYGLAQVEELRDLVEGGGGGGGPLAAAAALRELLTATYRWVPHGDGAGETYWLPAQLCAALPFFLGGGRRWPVAALAAAVGLEGVLCWRFWARGGLMWSYTFHVGRHFLANAVIAAGVLSTLPGRYQRAKDGTLPVGGKKGR